LLALAIVPDCNMTDIRTSALKTPVDVAHYLFTRLHQIGVRSVHGVPGDYNLVALDYIDKTGLKWVGSVNELNAGKHSLMPRLIETVPTAYGL
jgi:pyruvate decarboxylase